MQEHDQIEMKDDLKALAVFKTFVETERFVSVRGD